MPNSTISILLATALHLASGSASALPLPNDPQGASAPYAKEADGPVTVWQAPPRPAGPPRATKPASATEIPFPLYDVDEVGAPLVSGRTYKARFGPEGATYVPFFGSRASRNFPVTFHTTSVTVSGEPLALACAVTGARRGETVAFDRGVVVEEYAIRAESIEQRFVFDTLSRSGELRVAIEVESELEPDVHDGELRFGNELGHVSYGKAFAFDATGARIALASQLVDGRIELVVPATFVERAVLPLLIDPLITTFAVDTSGLHTFDPDVAFEVGTLDALVVYELYFSATDHDVYARIFPDMDLPWTVVLDNSSVHWEAPRVAANRDATNWLVVAQVGTVPNRLIRGRRVFPAHSLDAPFTISLGAAGDHQVPDVGGDVNVSFLGPTNYCVVWQRDTNGSDSDILARIVENDGTLPGGIIGLAVTPGSIDRNPSISKTNGRPPHAERDWIIVFEHEYAPLDTDVHGARIHYDGTITTPHFTVAITLTDERDPTASEVQDDHGVPRLWMAAYEYGSGLRLRSYQGTFIRDTLELLPALTSTFGEPDLTTDGRLWQVTYRSSFNVLPNPNTDIVAASLAAVGGTLYVAESPVAITVSSTYSETSPRIASTFGASDPYRSYIAYQSEGMTGLSNIHVGVYESPVNAGSHAYCYGTAAACPCGNAGVGFSGCENSAATGGARLSASGTWFVTADTAVLSATQLPSTAPALYFQGSADVVSGSAFGDGLLCVTGSITRMAVKFAIGGVSHFPEAGDPDLHVAGLVPATGGYRYYQAWHRDALPFCTSALFNLTNGVALLWAP